MNNKTICFFNSTQSWGGGEKWHYEMACYLFEKKYNVVVIVARHSVLHQKLKEKQIPVECIHVGNLSFLNPFKVAQVKTFYKKHGVHVVVLNSSEDMKLGGIAAKKAKLERIIYRRGSAIPIKNKASNRYFFKNVLTDILANSEATKTTINARNTTMFPKDKITVIPNAIATRVFLSKAYQPLYEKHEDEFVIGNLGRLVPQKNQSFLLEVTKELLDRKIPIKLIVGGSGILEAALKQKTNDLGITKIVVFTGFVSNPKDLMYSCDVFALSSLWEGFGYVIAEAFLCKKPVVAFDTSSNPELVKEGKNGFLVPLEDVAAFCDKIQFLFENKNKMESMGQHGKAQIITENDINVIFARVENYLVKGII